MLGLDALIAFQLNHNMEKNVNSFFPRCRQASRNIFYTLHSHTVKSARHRKFGFDYLRLFYPGLPPGTLRSFDIVTAK